MTAPASPGEAELERLRRKLDAFVAKVSSERVSGRPLSAMKRRGEVAKLLAAGWRSYSAVARETGASAPVVAEVADRMVRERLLPENWRPSSISGSPLTDAQRDRVVELLAENEKRTEGRRLSDVAIGRLAGISASKVGDIARSLGRPVHPGAAKRMEAMRANGTPFGNTRNHAERVAVLRAIAGVLADGARKQSDVDAALARQGHRLSKGRLYVILREFRLGKHDAVLLSVAAERRAAEAPGAPPAAAPDDEPAWKARLRELSFRTPADPVAAPPRRDPAPARQGAAPEPAEPERGETQQVPSPFDAVLATLRGDIAALEREEVAIRERIAASVEEEVARKVEAYAAALRAELQAAHGADTARLDDIYLGLRRKRDALDEVAAMAGAAGGSPDPAPAPTAAETKPEQGGDAPAAPPAVVEVRRIADAQAAPVAAPVATNGSGHAPVAPPRPRGSHIPDAVVKALTAELRKHLRDGTRYDRAEVSARYGVDHGFVSALWRTIGGKPRQGAKGYGNKTSPHKKPTGHGQAAPA